MSYTKTEKAGAGETSEGTAAGKALKRDEIIVRTSIIGIAANVFLAAFKAVVGLASHSIAIVMDAVNNILFVMILITVNLGIVNMLPFPALDGGRFLFLLIEWIFRKPIPRKVEKIVNTVGIILLFAFMAIISLKDVWQLITGTMPGM